MAYKYNPNTRRYLLAQTLAGNAGNTSPTDGWGMLSRIAQAYLATKMYGKADKQATADRKRRAQELSRALRVGKGPTRFNTDPGFIGPPNMIPGGKPEDMFGVLMGSEYPEHQQMGFQGLMGKLKTDAEIARADATRKATLQGKKDLKAWEQANIPPKGYQFADIGEEDGTQRLERVPGYKGDSKNPSGVDEYLFWKNLPEKARNDYLRVKRANKPLDTGGSIVIPSLSDPTKQAATYPKTPPPQSTPGYKGDVKKAEGEAEIAVAKRKAMPAIRDGIQRRLAKMPLLEKTVKKIEQLGKSFTTGGLPGQLLGWSAASDQYVLNREANAIRSLIGLKELIDVKEQGATFGSLTKNELDLLIDSAMALDPLLEDFPTKARDVLDLFKRGLQGDMDSFKKNYPKERVPWQNQKPNPPANTPSAKTPLSPEEKRELQELENELTPGGGS